ncbi:ribosomal protein L22/L17 [Apodospora peruviana]|uniref:Ribosomal protein L22/L17 n=1 Tax=Apodospora peruviana TaxID=516989 RepID=A0AAE0I3M1_9PEZI|nr:ribosomal protein L22/L17 [Apodospora peruviana]
MSLNLPSRRLLKSASSLAPSSSATNTLIPAFQSLSITPSNAVRSFHSTSSSQWLWGNKRNEAGNASSGPGGFKTDLTGTTKDARDKLQQRLTTRLEGDSIFKDEIASVDPNAPTSAPDRRKHHKPANTTATGASLAKAHINRAVDPDPRSRERWERKMIIRQIRRGTDAFSREPRADRIARTERQLTSKSPWIATSTKKLVKLAHQIQGKTVSEAVAQMRYSKKKWAQEVRFELEKARDQAVVERGMGRGPAIPEGEETPVHKEIKIQTKDGKHLTIDDPTRMYVAEAWVNRGKFRQPRIDYRARARMSLLKRPTTSISVVIKEEKTRIREHDERTARKLSRKPWVHLPDRPINGQRQYYSW